MKREASFWRLARFCAENEKELQSRDEECKAAFLSSEKQLQRIFQRQMDLSFAKLRIPKGEAEEIESLLRAKTEFGIRYWEIWKQTVIFE
ncbi:hypothetical protein LPTSP4_33300 [Leptospira ryugenii]|uniref:Uncharacterized protein n=2 Tax=Leptospira ryugenii TaxID=1917863 RepID=A0A2P2E4K4_9LEPT|nr:hypothetical protein LPTSP4_33300 [Leptospira ryugenii]